MYMKTNKFLLFLSFLLISVFLINSCKSKDENVIRIGAILPLTGGGSEWGIASRNAIHMALDELNQEKSNDLIFEVIFEDSKTNSRDAINALNKLHSQGIRFIIGDIISSNVLSMAPIVERNNILLISPGASNPDISHAGENIFRTWQSDALEAQVGAAFILDSLNWQRIAVLYLENGYGTGLSTEFIKLLREQGIEPVLIESFRVGQGNFRDIISKISNINPEGIYIASYPEENFSLLRQFQESNINIPVVGTQGFVSPKLDELLPLLSFPISYTIPEPPDSNAVEVRRFIDRYKEQFGVSPAITADAAYDAFMLLAAGIIKYGYDVDLVRTFLHSIIDYSGASGVITFNKYGDVEKPFKFIENEFWDLYIKEKFKKEKSTLKN